MGAVARANNWVLELYNGNLWVHGLTYPDTDSVSKIK